jgi:predicted dinucleotide-binding enzyme
MARALGGGLAASGHEVFFGSRDAEKARATAAEVGFGSRGGLNAEAAEASEILLHTVRAVPSSFLPQTSALSGKVVVDINNRDFPRVIASEPLFPSLFEWNERDVPSAKWVKCFNTMAMEVFDHAPEELRPLGVSAFLAGADEAARLLVGQLATDLGLHPVDLGGSENAAIVEMQGDFIRTAMFHQRNFLLISQVREIPAAPAPRFGGRRPGQY